MHVSDAKRFLKLIVEKQVPVAPLFVGIMGIGKSEIVKQVADELGIGFVDLRLAQMEPGDLIGIPYREGDRTKWAAPDWFPKKGTKGIIHLDELNRAPNDVRQTVFQLIWDKKMHLHALEAGWTVVASINPSNGEYQVEELDRAMLRRFIVLELTPHVDPWLEWAMKEGNVSNDITGFIGTHKDMLFEEERFEIPVKRNNAGWSVVNLLKKHNAMPRDLEYEITAGIVGKEAAAAFKKYLDDHYERPVAGEDVLKNYEAVRERIHKQKTQNDAMYVTIKELITLIEQKKKLGKKEMENVKDFLLDLPADMQAKLAHDLPPEIVSELGKDDRVTEAVGGSVKASKEGKK
jgi:hypothetical protein